MCNTAATINSCSLFTVSVSNDRRVGDAVTVTHETVYSKLYILPCRSTTLPLTIATISIYATIAGSSVANVYIRHIGRERAVVVLIEALGLKHS